MIRTALIIAALSPVSFCASVHEAPLPPSACPSPLVYSQEFEAAAGAQLKGVPEGSPVAQMIIDYGKERAALRACPNQNPPAKP